MRISDWSSDVCSSDLLAAIGRRRDVARDRAAFGVLRDAHAFAGAVIGPAVIAADDIAVLAPALGELCRAVAADRKSVVLGKSVSVSIAFGGRRIIKKKKNPFTHES